VVSLAFPHCFFQPGCEQSADGSTLLSGKNTRFAEKIRFDFQGDVCLPIRTFHCVAQFYVLDRRSSTGFLLCTLRSTFFFPGS
jgi:hypothetical protein